MIEMMEGMVIMVMTEGMAMMVEVVAMMVEVVAMMVEVVAMVMAVMMRENLPRSLERSRARLSATCMMAWEREESALAPVAAVDLREG